MQHAAVHLVCCLCVDVFRAKHLGLDSLSGHWRRIIYLLSVAIDWYLLFTQTL